MTFFVFFTERKLEVTSDDTPSLHNINQKRLNGMLRHAKSKKCIVITHKMTLVCDTKLILKLPLVEMTTNKL